MHFQAKLVDKKGKNLCQKFEIISDHMKLKCSNIVYMYTYIYLEYKVLKQHKNEEEMVFQRIISACQKQKQLLKVKNVIREVNIFLCNLIVPAS